MKNLIIAPVLLILMLFAACSRNDITNNDINKTATASLDRSQLRSFRDLYNQNQKEMKFMSVFMSYINKHNYDSARIFMKQSPLGIDSVRIMRSATSEAGVVYCYENGTPWAVTMEPPIDESKLSKEDLEYKKKHGFPPHYVFTLPKDLRLETVIK